MPFFPDRHCGDKNITDHCVFDIIALLIDQFYHIAAAARTIITFTPAEAE